MITQKTYNYARALYALSVPEKAIKTASECLTSSRELRTVLESPLVPQKDKDRVIRRIFPREMWNFMGYLCKHGMAARSQEIFQVYADYAKQKNGNLDAVLYYVTMPDDSQLDGIKAFLKKRFHVSEISISLQEKPELIGGFLLRAGDREYDWSVKGRIEQLAQRLIRR